jgi:HD-GYP domain-containing protein (c-di-GMP phosphodiesterase class II)
VLQLWRPTSAGPTRAGILCASVLLSATATFAAFAILAPQARWDQPELLAALAAIAAVAFFAEVQLKLATAAYFDASIVLALLALAIGGPLPALLIWLIPDLIARFVVRSDPIASPGQVVTVTSFALALLAGEGVLQLASPPSAAAEAPALFTAGLAMWAINFAVARLIVPPLYQGYRIRELVRSEFMDLAPAVMAMLGLAVGVWLLLDPLGVFALLLLASVILLPQLGLSFVARRRSVRRLTPNQATDVYAAAIADELALSRTERRLVGDAGRLLERWERCPPLGRAPRLHPLVGLVALGVDERWEGGGRPFGIPSSQTLLSSRVMAVARAWSGLTAAGTPGLSQTEAMLELSLRAGSELDPAVVEAAGQVVAEEQGFLRDPYFEPRLHRLPLPRALRRGPVAALLARLAEPA